MKRVLRWAPMAAAVWFAVCGTAAAKVPAAEADRLGKDLTCMGGEKAGNKDGTIPEFSGKWLDFPPNIKYTPHVGEFPPDPYADEKPLFTISQDNVAKYADKLSEGQKALLAKYPKTFHMNVYPTHRDFRYTDAVCAAAKKNALNAEMVDDGKTPKDAVMGAPAFPITKSGVEALSNNMLSARAYTEDTLRDTADVLSSGVIVWGRQRNTNLSLVNDPKNVGKPLEGIMAYTMNSTLLPERDKGTINLAIEPSSYAKGSRLAWMYDPGTRRVRQLPEFGFDQPIGGTGGKLTIDSDRLFNGSPERYTWTLLGKREMYIPANTYKINGKGIKYADLIKPGVPNPDYLRWELHRVWVLEGKLKEGYRHVYGKRVLFLDEDTWMSVMSDFYDSRGKLWQYAFINYYYAPDIHAWQAGTSFYFDLNSGGYVGYNLFQERDRAPVLNKGDLKPEMFTPEAARAMGQ
ncbi:MAG: DUF1329 domain-containing protein [Proteobacteria bacterium]|nr:DUF1329 domain-containing protein [Pseudomonadota bacterium]